MNTVTVTVKITAKYEDCPSIPLILKKHNNMKKTLKAIRKGNETTDSHYAFYNSESNTQIQINFCGICGNYVRRGNYFEIDEKLICCDLEHHKIENAKIYHKEMKQSLKKIEKCQKFHNEEKIGEELQKISALAKEWLING